MRTKRLGGIDQELGKMRGKKFEEALRGRPVYNKEGKHRSTARSKQRRGISVDNIVLVGERLFHRFGISRNYF